MEDWEALDVDDSDLFSLLRPCTNNNKPKSIPTLSLTQSNHYSPQTLTFLRRRIPGPAGAAQVAMDRKKRRLGEDDVSAQDCARITVENGCDGDGDGDDDDDFKLKPWLCALEFVEGLGPLSKPTVLRFVPEFLNIGRIDRVVAVIKSCTPNGLGDVMVALKDPTGAIAASIHRKVFADEELGKEIVVGSVLILEKVAVFAPSRSAVYLNITRSNVVKIISKDGESPTKQYTYESAVKPTSEYYKETLGNMEEASMELEMTQGINSGSGQGANPTSLVNNDKAKSFLTGNQNDTSADQIPKKVLRKEIIGEEQRDLNSAANLDEVPNSEGIGVQKEKQPPTVIASLPEWTDEQLNELFSADYEDGGFFS